MDFGNRPKVYMGSGGFRGMSEIRRAREIRDYSALRKGMKVYVGSGGVSARTLLASGGIAGGGLKRIGAEVKPKVVADIPPKVEKPKMTEKEERLADYLEVAQRMKKECDEADAMQSAEPPPKIPIEERAVLPELSLGDVPQTGKKKRRKRRSQKNQTAGEAPQPTAV